LADAFAAHPDDVALVEAFAQSAGLEVVAVDAPRRAVTLAGTVAALSEAFGVELGEYELGDARFRGRSGPLYVSAGLAPAVQAVLGLDDRPQARPHVRRAAAVARAYTPPELAQLYDFPPDLDGSGETIAIVELGGGYSS